MLSIFFRQINPVSFLIIIMTITPCSADELELHLASYHINEDSDDSLNEFNIGAGYNYEIKPNIFAIIGAFNNSYDKLAIYTGAKWLPIEYKFIKAGLVGGVVTGYDDDTDAEEVQPTLIPEIQFHHKQFYIVSRISPDLGDNSSAAITFSIGYILP